MQKLGIYDLKVKQAYKKEGVNLYDVVTTIDESMIDSLKKAISSEPEEDEVAKEVIYEYLKTDQQDLEDFKQDAYLKVSE